MHYHLPQRNSMIVPRMDAKDYALAVDWYGINADWKTLERIGKITMCPGSRICLGMCGPMVTVDPVKFEDWELRPSHRQHQTQCWSDRSLSARWNIPDNPQLGQILGGLIVTSISACPLQCHILQFVQTQRQEEKKDAKLLTKSNGELCSSDKGLEVACKPMPSSPPGMFEHYLMTT